MIKYLCFVMLINVLTFADVNDLLMNANQFYKSQNYDNAITAYEEVLSQGYAGASVHYNLGNSYYRIGKIGLAILHYEKALKYAPNDDDIIHNLQLASMKTVDKVEAVPQFFLFGVWESVISIFTIDGWAIVAYVLFILLLLAFGLIFFLRSVSIKRNVFFFSLPFLILFIFSVFIFLGKLKIDKEIKYGIILENAVNVKAAPDENSSNIFVIHEGLKIKIEDKVDIWVKIRLIDGKVGWINKHFAKNI